MQWNRMDAEAVPVDGAPIDLWGTLYDPATTTPVRAGSLAGPQRWVSCRYYYSCEGHTDMDALGGPKSYGWFVVYDNYRYRIWPTHWMRVEAPEQPLVWPRRRETLERAPCHSPRVCYYSIITQQSRGLRHV